jgi:signal transduction histidine kinase
MVVALADSKFCRHLTVGDQRFVAERSVVREFDAGVGIFQEGDPGDGLYVVQSGLVEITAQSTPDRQHLLSRMEPGDYFGEMAIFDGGTRSATATTCEPTHTRFLPAAAVLELLRRSPMLAPSLVRDASLRMREFNRRFLRESLRSERLVVIERLARTIVHDFRNPLNVIGIAADMAAMESATPPARIAARDRIRHQVEVVNRMLEELLDFTRGVSTDAVLPRVRFSDFLRQVLIELAAEAARRGIAVDVPALLPEVDVRLDPPRFSRVLTNLYQNAFDALGDRPDGRLEIHFQISDTAVVTEFVDNGPGIPADHLAHVFEPFFTFGKAHGTGLGLAICERIVREHGGRIWAESTPGHGATFRVELPRARAGDTDRVGRTATA